MKRFLPRALPAWVLMIVIIGLLTTQAAFFSITTTHRSETDLIVELYRLNERALWLVKLLSPLDGEKRKQTSSTLANSTFAVTVSQRAAVTSSNPPDEKLAELEDIMVSRMAKFGVVDAHIRLTPARTKEPFGQAVSVETSDSGEVESDLATIAQDFSESDRYTVSVALKDGQWVNFTTPATPVGPLLSPESLPIYIGIAVCVAVLSVWAIRRLIAPYLLLEAALTRLGEDFRSPPLAETGTKEYRSAARAVNAMQARLVEYVEDREYLAAALAHDLRTPITRMRLRLEQLRNATVREALANDIRNVERTVRSVVDFVKLRVSEEEAERIDFWSVVYAIVDEFPEATIAEDQFRHSRLLCEAQPTALRRIISNLIDNAVKYGKSAQISIATSSSQIALVIVDEGPGIPESNIEGVFRPFKRVESSRSSKTGGSGLGLTIARGLVRKMGGDITLSNVETGGLRATLTIPRLDT
jgi:signal transduction histidine kinase